MAFAGVFIQDGQHPQRSTPHGRIGNEVPRPYVSAMGRLRGQSGGDAPPRDLPLGRRHSQPLQSSQALDVSLAHPPTFPSQ